MLYRICRNIDFRTLLLIQNGRLHVKNLHILSAVNSVCLCGRYSSGSNFNQPFRIHSSLSDSKRQKVVLETSTPKIVIDKLPSINNKVLPDENNSIRNKFLEFKDLIDPYLKLMRIDKPIGKLGLFIIII